MNKMSSSGRHLAACDSNWTILIIGYFYFTYVMFENLRVFLKLPWSSFANTAEIKSSQIIPDLQYP